MHKSNTLACTDKEERELAGLFAVSATRIQVQTPQSTARIPISQRKTDT